MSSIVGRRHLRHRRRLPPADAVPRAQSFVVLEALESFGGTWHTHRYPGIRSDSDLYTFGYRFKPWTGAPIATGERDPDVPERGHRRERPRPAHPLPAPHHLGRAGPATRAAGPSRPRAPTPARPSASPPTSCGCARATTATPSPTRPSGRAWTASRAGSCTRRRGPRTSTTRASGCVVIGSGATAATLVPAIAGDVRARHDAAALARPTSGPAATQRARRHAARAATSPRSGPTRSCAARSSTTRTPSPHVLRGARARQGAS